MAQGILGEDKGEALGIKFQKLATAMTSHSTPKVDSTCKKLINELGH